MPLENGRYITIDCVVRSFDYEEPYTEKKDTNMDLEYLNGVPDTRNYKTTDAQDFMSLASEQEALSELGKLFKRKSSGGGSEGGGKKKGFARLKEIAKKGLHLTNKLNPATAVLRAGVLAAMKLNFMKIGGQIRYAYLTEEQAKQKGLVMDRYFKMKKILEKLEKIFYGAGGKPENLKKAILTGKGNKNKEVPVNGLGYITSENAESLHEDMPLSQLIGRDMYSSESMDGIEGLGELGEPATAATIAAATTVLTTIVALIKKVGSLVPKKKADGNSGGGESGGGSEEGGSDNASSGEDDSNTSEDSFASGGSGESTNGSNLPSTNKSKTPATNDNNESGGDEGDDAGDNSQQKKTKSDGSGKPSFWDNHKKWIKPVGIGVGSLGLIALIYHLLKPKPKPKQALSGAPKKGKGKTGNNLLNGIKSKAKKGGYHPAKKHKAKGKKKVVTLL